MADQPSQLQHVQVLRTPSRFQPGLRPPGQRSRQRRYTVYENGAPVELLQIHESRGVVLATAYAFLDALGYYWHHERGCTLRVPFDQRIEGYRRGWLEVVLEIREVE